MSRYVMDLGKTYSATARFGAVSDTLDAEGGITALDTPPPPESAILEALPDFTGDLLQVPPMASALKRGGTRLYDLHRRGIRVDREPRLVTVNDFELASLDPATEIATFEITCSSGTYVRTLIADLAARLGSGAYLTALRRTSVGHLTVKDAVPPQNLTPETLRDRIIPPLDVVAHLPSVSVSEVVRDLVCHGRPIKRRGIPGSYAVMCGGEFLAVYRDEEDQGLAEVVLCAE